MRSLITILALSGLAFSAAAQPLAAAHTSQLPELLASAAPAPGVAEPTEPTPRPLLGLSRVADAPEPKKFTILPIPVLFYQEETGLGYGLGGFLSGRFGTDTVTRQSSVRVQYWQTQKKQSLLQLTHNIFTPGENYLFTGEISRYDILLFYYGIGNNTLSSDESSLAYKLFIINQRAQKQIVHKLFAGVQYRFTNTSDIEPRDNAQDGNDNKFIRDASTGVIDPKAVSDHAVSLLGPVLTYDNRDNPFTTFRGEYVDASVMFGGSGIGSDYKFTRYQIDARHFQPLFGSTRTILALQFLGQFHTGDVPFRELAGIGANLGGTLYNNANIMRGIYEQRYRDRQLAVVQAEVRQHLFWRLDGAVFGSAGETASGIDKFDADGLKYAGGAGIRFNFIRRDRVNLRLDYATGSGGFSGIYFFIGEAF